MNGGLRELAAQTWLGDTIHTMSYYVLELQTNRIKYRTNIITATPVSILRIYRDSKWQPDIRLQLNQSPEQPETEVFLLITYNFQYSTGRWIILTDGSSMIHLRELGNSIYGVIMGAGDMPNIDEISQYLSGILA